jgi:hypothetical protein
MDIFKRPECSPDTPAQLRFRSHSWKEALLGMVPGPSCPTLHFALEQGWGSRSARPEKVQPVLRPMLNANLRFPQPALGAPLQLSSIGLPPSPRGRVSRPLKRQPPTTR